MGSRLRRYLRGGESGGVGSRVRREELMGGKSCMWGVRRELRGEEELMGRESCGVGSRVRRELRGEEELMGAKSCGVGSRVKEGVEGQGELRGGAES